MKAVILAGGLGTRISEETHLKPKPMIEIGGRPILWHIMKLYSAHGVNDFVICCGYKGYLIKEYFANYFLHMSDVTFDMSTSNTNAGPPSPPSSHPAATARSSAMASKSPASSKSPVATAASSTAASSSSRRAASTSSTATAAPGKAHRSPNSPKWAR